MKPIANQKLLTINKEVVTKESGRAHPYLITYVDTIYKAAKDLKGNTFKVYIYLLCNQNGFRFGLSPQDISNKMGISVDSARDAINSLIAANYISLLDGTKCEYMFYDKKDNKPIELPVEAAQKLNKKLFYSPTLGNVELTFDELVELVGDTQKAAAIWQKED